MPLTNLHPVSWKLHYINDYMKYKNEIDIIELWTDGACKGNPGRGGWGVLMLSKHFEKTIYGGENYTTNNRMELTAVIKGLNLLKKSCQVIIYTDSSYVTRGINDWIKVWKKNDWITSNKKPVKNIELWKILDLEVNRHELVEFHWVKGHAKNVKNERADQLANAGIENLTK